ncbi:MAG TPA: hypothetical protein ENJ56_00610, partial [Anaerolineae bacterium]|nr:hypothetical protein [Anaerolineae bacterium]
VPRLVQYMQRVRDLGLDKKVFFLVGVGPLKGPKSAEFMRSKIPGVHIPDAIIKRLKGVTGKKARNAEGKKICVEIIQQVREIVGVDGVHIMAYRQEEVVGELLDEAGLLPRPFKLHKPKINPDTFAPPAIAASFESYTKKLVGQ